MNNEPLRPDPDRLLEQTAAPHRGKLKVFFGACAGVGKTWAMLAEAQRLRAQGLDIVVGVVETHGRKDTAAMLEGLAVLPPKRQAYRGRHISEFDLDAALARRPALILMDELAHSNAPGSRHPKRWQDIEELLEAGIDVFTTVNVQHLESLNDVVSGVTGIQVRETVPDPFFDAADDVVLVDFHAEATSEKGAMAWYLDGRAQAVWGTHTHVPTADCQLLPKGTGFVTDLGMTGPYRSVLGIRPEHSMNLFLGGLPRRYEEAEGNCKLNACLFTIDTEKKRCVEVRRADLWE